MTVKSSKTDPKEIDFFWKISESVVSGRYLKEILQLLVTMTAEMMNSKICSIFLLDEKQQELVIEATQSSSQDYIRKPNISVHQSVSGRAIQERRPIAIADVAKEKQFRFPHLARTERVVSLLSVPMMIGDQAMGVVNVYTAEPHEFTDGEVKLLRVVANQAAVAIQNTKLQEDAVAARNEVELKRLINRAKAALQKEKNLTEDAAHRMLNRISRNSRKSLREVAEAVLLAYSTVKQRPD
jgi:GAF domain-containing protein